MSVEDHSDSTDWTPFQGHSDDAGVDGSGADDLVQPYGYDSGSTFNDGSELVDAGTDPAIADIANLAGDVIVPFPIGYLAGRLATGALVRRGMDPATARKWGRVVGWTTSAVTFWGGVP